MYLSILPTHFRYDNGTQTYDSSEKQRIPAWTDRILFAGKGLDLSRYNRAELLSSDHRPIYATLRAKIKIIDSIKKSTIRKNLLAEIKVDPTYLDNIGRNEKLSKSITAASLPPPSDDNQAWFGKFCDFPSLRKDLWTNLSFLHQTIRVKFPLLSIQVYEISQLQIHSSQDIYYLLLQQYEHHLVQQLYHQFFHLVSQLQILQDLYPLYHHVNLL